MGWEFHKDEANMNSNYDKKYWWPGDGICSNDESYAEDKSNDEIQGEMMI
jgi:hypothetical protein